MHGVELTYGDIARRGGKVITRGRVQQLAKDPVKQMPGATTLAALALGLGVPEHLVVEKALASAGYGDLGVAARRGTPLQVQKDAAEPDPNVDPEGPPEGA
jgi:transcriptional regulator with XRE-family HTH domain